jgi:hypothetical protein
MHNISVWNLWIMNEWILSISITKSWDVKFVIHTLILGQYSYHLNITKMNIVLTIDSLFEIIILWKNGVWQTHFVYFKISTR